MIREVVEVVGGQLRSSEVNSQDLMHLGDCESIVILA